MIITVLWEDALGRERKGFGPHELLIACLVDDSGLTRQGLKRLIESHPKKGNGGVLADLRQKIRRLENSGPVFAVIDRDQARELFRYPGPLPSDCMTGIGGSFRKEAPGNYDLVFLINNTETLLDAACSALGDPLPNEKPRPDERDQILGKAAWAASTERKKIRSSCPSFDRLVSRIGQAVKKGG